MKDDDFSNLAAKFNAVGLTNIASDTLRFKDQLSADTALGNAELAQLKAISDAVAKEKKAALRGKSASKSSRKDPRSSSAVAPPGPGESREMLLAASGNLADVAQAKNAARRYLELYGENSDVQVKNEVGISFHLLHTLGEQLLFRAPYDSNEAMYMLAGQGFAGLLLFGQLHRSSRYRVEQ